MSVNAKSTRKAIIRLKEDEVVTAPSTALDIKDYYSIEEESYHNWNNIIFLPFNRLWETVIMVTVVVNFIVILYDFVFASIANDSDDKVIGSLHYICEILYFCDVITATMHRNMPFHSKTRVYPVKNLFLIALDFITLIPIYEMYMLFHYCSHDKNYNPIIKYARSKSLLRTYRLIIYFSVLRTSAGLNQLTVLWFGHLVEFIIIAMLFASLWFSFGCWQCNYKNWTEHLKDYIFNPQRPPHWLVLSFTTIGNCLAQNFTGIIKGETHIERLIIMSAMLIGYILNINLLFAQLTAIFMKKLKKQHSFTMQLNKLKVLLDDWKIPMDFQEKSFNYYHTLWARRNGFATLPKFFQKFPRTLQLEVHLDIFFEALRHSHIFASEDIPFKRELAAQMKSEFCMPGDFLFKINGPKNKLVYIVSGIVEVLSDEDEESTIIAFSAGTLLAEYTCIMSSFSIVHVKCATFCEFFTLSLADLFRFLWKFPKKTQIMREAVSERIAFARKMKNIATTEMKLKQIHSIFVEEESNIKWLKRRWRSLQHSQKVSKGDDATSEIQASHCSNFLDLLVLSDEVELKIKTICLTSHFPFILDPDSSFLVFWNYVSLASVVFQVIFLPYRIAFARSLSMNLVAFQMISDAIYIVDFLIETLTAVKHKNVLARDWGSIVVIRGKRISFLIDCLTICNVDYIVWFTGASEQTLVWLKVNRLFKVYRCPKFFEEFQKKVWLNDLYIRCLKYVFIFVISSYWFACALYALACFKPSCNPTSWYAYSEKLMMDRLNRSIIKGNEFQLSIFAAAHTYLGFASTFQNPYNITDVLIFHLLAVGGFFMFSVCSAELCSAYMLNTEQEAQHVLQIMNIKKSETFSTRLSPMLRKQILSYIKFQWETNKSHWILQEKTLLGKASVEIFEGIIEKRIIDTLLLVPFFKIFEPRVLKLVAACASLRTLPPKEFVMANNIKASWVMIIVRGHCSVMSEMKGDKHRKTISYISRGAAFPLIEVLHKIYTFISVRSVTAVEIISISIQQLNFILKSEPQLLKDIQISVENHMKADEQVLLRKDGRLPEMIPDEASRGQGDMFVYDIYDDLDELILKQNMYMKPFIEECGKWAFIRFFLFRETLNPNHKKFIIWESFRSLITIARISVALVYFNYLYSISNAVRVTLLMSLESILLVDMYVRLHVQYYNEDGLLVSHPLYTSRRYLRTSWVIDFISIFPFVQLEIHKIFGDILDDITGTLLTLFSRSLQLYHVLGWLDYIKDQKVIKINLHIMECLKGCILIAYLIACLVNITMMMSCQFAYDNELNKIVAKCATVSWLDDEENINSIVIQATFLVVYSLIQSESSVSINRGQNELFWLIFMFTLGNFVRWILLANMTSYMGKNTSLLQYQTRIQAFKYFVKNENVDEQLVEETIDYFEYLWQRTLGISDKQQMSQLHPLLHIECAKHLYQSTIVIVPLFEKAEMGFHRKLLYHIDTLLLKENMTVIRCNDIQTNLYIVLRGEIDIFAAGSKVATLKSGGMFGNFTSAPRLRQTITAKTSNKTADLIVINSGLLHQIAMQFPDVKASMAHVDTMRVEFLVAKTKNEDNIVNVQSQDRKILKMGILSKYFITTINPNCNYIQWWDYLTCMYIAPISAICDIFLSLNYWEPIGIMELFITKSLDIFFLLRIIIGCKLTYLDKKRGIVITSSASVAKRYFKSFRFFMDLISGINGHLICVYLIKNIRVVRLTKINRALRFYFMMYYYNKKCTKLNMSIHVKFLYLLYWLTFVLQIGCTVWWHIGCKNYICEYIKHVGNVKIELVQSTNIFDALVICYSYVTNLFTCTGYDEVLPHGVDQCLAVLFIIFISQVVFYLLMSGFTSILITEKQVMVSYEYEIENLYQYLQDRELSPAILKKVWQYCLEMWRRSRGDWLPVLIQEAPTTLKQDLMYGLYGKHLETNYLFYNTHIDFLRQLVCHLKRFMFFPGDYIVEKGDVDFTMYFIHNGEVEVYTKKGNMEIAMQLLSKNSSFGVGSGLYHLQHEFSYKAKTIVDILCLCKKDWETLVTFFPASHQEILERAALHGIFRPRTEMDREETMQYLQKSSNPFVET